MSEQNDGGQAFPLQDAYGPARDFGTPGHPGMTLRDWFAGRALAGLLAGRFDSDNVKWAHRGDAQRAAMFAENSYFVADAMLAERAKKDPKP